MLLLGHRGARLYAPENTITAFELALAHGCHGFEFDVRRTADGRAVICHDSRVAGLEVATSSLVELTSRQHFPITLEELLSRFAACAYLYIELKVCGLEDAVLAALKASPPQRGYVIASFLPEALTAVHFRDAETPLGFICKSPGQLPLWRTLPVSVVMPQYRLAAPEFIAAVHNAGKQVFAWTVNQPGCMRELAACGVDGIVSDDTLRLCQTIGQTIG